MGFFDTLHVRGDVTGTITTGGSLDHELERVYHMVVAVLSSPSSLPSNTSDVIIYVNDVNDNSPIFDFPSPSNDTVYVSNRQQPG